MKKNLHYIIKIGIYSILYFSIFNSGIMHMYSRWSREDYNFSYLIPFVIIYILWEKRTDFRLNESKPSWFGFLPFGGGIILFWLGELGGEYFSLYMGAWLVLIGILLFEMGWEKLKIAVFPIFFMLAMFPLPDFLHFNLTFQLKLLSSKLGVWILQAYGMTAYREGNIIDLGFTQLQVVDACSGLRYLFPLIIMAILVAYFFNSDLWKRIIIILTAIPLTIFTNSLRIALTGVLYEIWGPAVAEDFFHGFSGWFIFMFGFAVLLLVMWVLQKISPEKKFADNRKDSRKAHSKSKKEVAVIDSLGSGLNEARLPKGISNPDFKGGIGGIFSPPQFIVAIVLMASTIAAAQGIDFRENIPPAKAFSDFPIKMAGWDGKRDMIEQKIIDNLDLDDYVIIHYRNSFGKEINFYSAYYESQRKGESIHSPETCLPGGGWEFKRAGRVELPLASQDGKPMRVNRAIMEKGGQKQVAYFWFPQRDRVLTNAWQLKVYNFWDALTRQRTDGGLVRLVTPIYPEESAEDADHRLVGFSQMIVPVLNEYFPK